GVADPAGIVAVLSDPILWRSARLNAVVCVVDGADFQANPERMADPLCQAQLRAAGFIVLAKTADAQAASALAARLSPSGSPPVLDLDREPAPADLFYGVARQASRF